MQQSRTARTGSPRSEWLSQHKYSICVHNHRYNNDNNNYNNCNEKLWWRSNFKQLLYDLSYVLQKYGYSFRRFYCNKDIESMFVNVELSFKNKRLFWTKVLYFYFYFIRQTTGSLCNCPLRSYLCRLLSRKWPDTRAPASLGKLRESFDLSQRTSWNV